MGNLLAALTIIYRRLEPSISKYLYGDKEDDDEYVDCPGEELYYECNLFLASHQRRNFKCVQNATSPEKHGICKRTSSLNQSDTTLSEMNDITVSGYVTASEFATTKKSHQKHSSVLANFEQNSGDHGDVKEEVSFQTLFATECRKPPPISWEIDFKTPLTKKAPKAAFQSKAVISDRNQPVMKNDLPVTKLSAVNKLLSITNAPVVNRATPISNVLLTERALPCNDVSFQYIHKGDECHSRPITTAEIAHRKVFDIRRWYCMCRPQYKKSCGISSVVSVWNYLFSTVGTGSLPPVTQEEALLVLGYHPPFGEISFGPFTGNATLMRWFRQLNDFFQVHGKAHYLYKPKGRFKTRMVTEENAITNLKYGLRSENTGFIYHCLNHYFCPIGYEETPEDPTEAYCSSAYDGSKATDYNSGTTQSPVENWIFIGEPSKKHPPIHCKSWSEILVDLNMESPNFYDIRRPEKGMQIRKSKKKGGNLHCILAFRKVERS